MARLPEHTPVLGEQVVALLEPGRRRWIVDCTVGLGGHAENLLERADESARLVAIDRDEQSLRRAKERLARFQNAAGDRLRFFHANFADIRQVLAQADMPRADALLADLGLCSAQLDSPERGFSFTADAPLDMRMDSSSASPTAADLVNTLGQAELADLLYCNAQERHSRRIAQAIVQARQAAPIRTTGELAELVARAVGGRRGARIHPATRTFQALRMAVNAEVQSLEALLAALPEVLAPGARAAIISFHSLEDRPVKRAFSSWKSAGRARIITPKPVGPDDEELKENPRSRSAKLRCLEWMEGSLPPLAGRSR